MYVHWLEIGGIRINMKDEDKQWDHLKKYLSDYPESKATVYIKNTGDLFARVVRLECKQNYRDLDLECNSCSDCSIRQLNYKPQNIEICKKQIDYFFNRERAS
jgi:hypothetical protein